MKKLSAYLFLMLLSILAGCETVSKEEIDAQEMVQSSEESKEALR